MKKYLLLFLIFLASISFAQKNIIGKEYTTKIGSIYEETPEPVKCSGSTDYLVLKFKNKNVDVIEKRLKCNEEQILHKNNFIWRIVKNKIDIQIPSNNQSSFIKNLDLRIKNNQLIGYKEDWQKKKREYIFTQK
ncbi:hypothetical protein SAMN05444360_10639 [Chryseobacterium carnipullorum]|uniref:hypothetical protein n=1 Tax=Chryseobacterium carnipullorum TaxID=1124835 RepID=UPI0009196527|nr:hypothetical protein [Chryseobacterium carnipullorum]SHL93433.1 hypothetical protein SAMN05444360_10639 [Chryseobacterium carnipullorum]